MTPIANMILIKQSRAIYSNTVNSSKCNTHVIMCMYSTRIITLVIGDADVNIFIFCDVTTISTIVQVL